MSTPLYGLTVRWSLHGAPAGVADALRDLVRDVLHTADRTHPDLHQALWTLREGGSFGVTSVWASVAARAAVVERLRAEGSPVTAVLGHRADAVEEFEVIESATGPAFPAGRTAAGGGAAVVPAPSPAPDLRPASGQASER